MDDHNMLFYALCTLSFAVFITGESTLSITTCKRDSVDYSTCFKHFLEESWPQIIQGFPEYDFPTLEPLLYKYGKVTLNSSIIQGEVSVFNLTGFGLSKAHFLGARTLYLNNVFRLEIDVQIPNMFINGSYKMNGILNVFKIDGGGYINISGDDIRATWNLTGPVVNDTWIVEHFRVAPSPAKLKVYIENLIKDNKEINDIILSFINEFWPPIYRAVLPFASDIWDPWAREYPNKIFSKVPFSQMFP